MGGEPFAGTFLDCRCGRRVRFPQGLHAGAQAKSVKRIDGRGSVAALRAAGAASEPTARALGCIGERRIHDLHELPVTGGKAHAAKDTRMAGTGFSVNVRSCYKRHEVNVLFLERIPAAPLVGFVHSLWYARAADAGHRRERILPSGRVQIIVNLAREFILDCPEGECDRRVAPALIVGARSIYEVVDTSDIADLIGIVFEPGGFGAFASDAVDRFSNCTVALEDLWGSRTRALRDRLREIPSPQARLQCLEGFLMDRFSGHLKRNERVTFALDQFRQAPCVAAAVRDVARSTGWSERRFSQVFREEVGLSPKVWCRIQRFQRAVRMLHEGGEVRWAELALDCGFYDQSHFANEFKAFSGIDATTYTARRTLWANHIAVQ
jgi:AraC-like DNA-binding protein